MAEDRETRGHGDVPAQAAGPASDLAPDPAPDAAPDPAVAPVASPIPATVIGGYLGAGKTTLVNHLLRNAGGRRLAVLVNELGDLPIDADLVEGSSDGVISITGGCVCCSYGSDLVAAMMTLAGSERRVDQVLIEASGVGLPGAIAASVGLLPRYRLDGVVVLADAETVRARGNDRYMGDTITRQLGDADVVLLNKSDLVDAGVLSSTHDWVQQQAVRARIVTTHQGSVPADVVLGTPSPARHEHVHVPAHDPGAAYRHWTVELPRPLDASALARRLSQPDLGLLRAKGFVRESAGGPTGRLAALQVMGARWQVSAATDTVSGEGRLVLIGLTVQVDEAAVARAIDEIEAAART